MKKLINKILEFNREVWTIILAFLVVFALTTLMIVLTHDRNKGKETGGTALDRSSEEFIKATTIHTDEISSHSTTNDCWIIYKDGVYDISAIISSQKVIKKSACGTTISDTLDSTTEAKIRPYLISYTFESQSK